jgi:nucleoside-diphosphate-sugar epimerase
VVALPALPPELRPKASRGPAQIGRCGAVVECHVLRQIYNVGLSDANVSKKELCARIQQFVPDFVFIDAQVGRDPDQRNYIVLNEKIERTDYRPGYSLDRGIQELLKGFVMLKNSVYGNV